MKKTVLFLCAAIVTVITTQAQSTRFGFKGGVNANTFYLKSEGTASDSRYSLTKPGFHVGGIADFKFSENFSIQPQLLFAMKGGKIKMSGTETEFNFYTIDLPVNFLYHHNGFFIGAGPNLSYGVSGKGKSSSSTTEVDLYKDGALGAGTKFERFEVGVNATMGYTCPSGLTLATNFTPGLTDILDEASSATGSTKAHNGYWGFSVGYLFGGSKTMKKK